MSAHPVPVVTPPESAAQPLTGPPPLWCAPTAMRRWAAIICAACGQRNEPHLHTVAHFAAEAFESISHADSRLWSTLWYLLARPGFLTREFFKGRRVRYLPPFRLYLVISVVFFVWRGPPNKTIEIDEKTSNESHPGLNAAADQLEKQAPERRASRRRRPRCARKQRSSRPSWRQRHAASRWPRPTGEPTTR